MSLYRKIYCRIWNDERFVSLSERGKLVFLFVATHPNLTMLGAMRATVPGLAAELRIDQQGFGEAFAEVLTKGMAKHDEQACFVWLPNFLKYNKPESPNVVKAWPHAYDLLPECALKIELLDRLEVFVEGLTKGFQEAFREGFRDPLAKGMANQEQEQQQDQELKVGGARKRAATPKPPRVRESPELQLARRALERREIANSGTTRDLAAQVIGFIKNWGHSLEEAAQILEEAIKASQESRQAVDDFWFKDNFWRDWCLTAARRRAA